MPDFRSHLWGAAAVVLFALNSASAEACTVTTTAVAFGNYDPLSLANDDGTGTVALACHPSVQSPVVEIDAGSSGSIASRRMLNGATVLNYNLYTDVARTILWGDGVVGVTVTLTGGTVSGGQRRFSRSIHGRIPAGENVGVGNYSDTLIVTVTF